MVKIKFSPSKKNYLKGKHIYDYIRAHLTIPHKFFNKLEPYFKEDFQANITEDNSKIALTYIYFKRANESKKSAVEPEKK